MKFTVQQFIKFSTPFEGVVQTMYQDSKGLVTVGMGELIEPIQLGWGMPWKHADGTPATQSEYIAEWNVINGNPELAKDGWVVAARFCKLHLDIADIEVLVQAKLNLNEEQLRKRVPNYDNLCADAQLFLHSWAWAVGAGASYPRMLKLVNAGNFMGAIMECDINPKVGTIILRNEANHQLLTNAANVAPGQDMLVYPSVVGDTTYDHSVTSLQHALALLGYDIAQDGIMGPVTVDTIKKFQATRKLTVDGIAGPLTWAALQTAMRFR